jgi:hypothetical protein
VAQPEIDTESIDGSETIFAMYLEISLREDKEMVGVWNQDAKSILLFVSSPLLRSRVHQLMTAEWVVLCHSGGSFGANLAGPDFKFTGRIVGLH